MYEQDSLTGRDDRKTLKFPCDPASQSRKADPFPEIVRCEFEVETVITTRGSSAKSLAPNLI